jgi:hypothetical protein
VALSRHGIERHLVRGWKEDWERVVRNMVGSLSHFLFFAMCGADKLISFFFPIR